MSTYCCSMMEGNSTAYCGEHADDPASCPDVTVAWSWRHGPGLPIPSSAGGGQIAIRYCPWCATEISTVKEPTAEGDTCPLVQLDGRMSGQVTVDHSRMPASTVLALFLGGCEVERVLGMYPWLDGAQAAVLHRLAADLAAKGVVVAEGPGSTPLRSAVQPTREATRMTRPTISDWDLDDLLICAARYAVTAAADDLVRARTAGLVVAHVPWLSERAAVVVQRDLTGWAWPDLPARDDEWAPVLAAVVDRPEPTGPRPPLTTAELDDLLLSCTFYAVGRATYVTSCIAGLLRWHAPWLAPTVRDTITGHIRSAVAAGRSGWDCDTEAWQQALTALTAAAGVSR